MYLSKWVTKWLELMGVVIIWVTKPFKRLDVSTKLMNRQFKCIQNFFQHMTQAVRTDTFFSNGLGAEFSSKTESC